MNQVNSLKIFTKHTIEKRGLAVHSYYFFYSVQTGLQNGWVVLDRVTGHVQSRTFQGRIYSLSRN